MVPEEAPEEDPEVAPTAVTEGALTATSGYFERVSQLQAQRTTTAR